MDEQSLCSSSEGCLYVSFCLGLSWFMPVVQYLCALVFFFSEFFIFKRSLISTCCIKISWSRFKRPAAEPESSWGWWKLKTQRHTTVTYVRESRNKFLKVVWLLIVNLQLFILLITCLYCNIHWQQWIQ